MMAVEKSCPIVIQKRGSKADILAFVHPLAGKQFVKGSIESGELPVTAAVRELQEESGLVLPAPMEFIGDCLIGDDQQRWHFFSCVSSGLPRAWQYKTEDDLGHIFTFFWHPLDSSLNQDWHPIFHQAFNFFSPLLIRS